MSDEMNKLSKEDRTNKTGIRSSKAALGKDGVMPSAQTNTLNEVVSENVMRNPNQTLLMEAGILTTDMAASTPDVPEPGDDSVPPHRGRRGMAPPNGDPAVVRSEKKSSSPSGRDPETEGRISP